MCLIFRDASQEPKKIQEKIKNIFPNVEFFIIPNRGYDIGAFIHFLNNIDFMSYEYVLKIHTKSFKKGWRLKVSKKSFKTKRWIKTLINSLLKKKNILNNFKILENNKTVTMLGGIVSQKNTHYKHLLDKINTQLEKIGLDKVDTIRFVPGTMFLAKSFIFERLKCYSIDNFNVTQSNVKDETLAHIVERIFGVLACYYGELQNIVQKMENMGIVKLS